MTKLHDRNTVQRNERTFRTEIYTNKQYNRSFRHANQRINEHVEQPRTANKNSTTEPQTVRHTT